MPLNIPGAVVKDRANRNADPIPPQVVELIEGMEGHVRWKHVSEHGLHTAMRDGYEFIKYDDLMSVLPDDLKARMHVVRDVDGGIRWQDTKLAVCNLDDWKARLQDSVERGNAAAGTLESTADGAIRVLGNEKQESLEREVAAIKAMLDEVKAENEQWRKRAGVVESGDELPVKRGPGRPKKEGDEE